MGGFVIGIDVGGAKVALAAADLAGRRLSKSRFKVSEAGGAQEVLTRPCARRPAWLRASQRSRAAAQRRSGQPRDRRRRGNPAVA